MNNPIRFLFDRLTERIFGIIASSAGSAASACRAANEAQQQSLLEDLARQYEADGKQQIADRLRSQAASIECLDPASDGASVLDRIGCDVATPSLPGTPPEKLDPHKKSRSKRRSRRSMETPVEKNLGNSIGGEIENA